MPASTETNTGTNTETSTESPAKAYAVAYLREVDLGPAIVDYIERIDATMAPYGGRFLVHGGAISPLEGSWDGDLVILEFPDAAAARDWYHSPAYQEILPLRTEHSTSIACVVEGVPVGYRAVDKLAVLLP
ncbi:DUF1330 domain-containing protein [Nocardioides sambongensis]|uniref:DUF1330 domain-containing protein n=1 Tax=Nocardioides sambongensis TaxID=2589074 RepID=UPI00112EB17D|nr:DUF1330 domain-containing protein [Nocardioides sambongensis]